MGEVILDYSDWKSPLPSSKSNRGPWSSTTLQHVNFIGRSHNKHFIESEGMPGNPSFTIHPNADREMQLVKTKCQVSALRSCRQENWKLCSLEAAQTPAGDLLPVSSQTRRQSRREWELEQEGHGKKGRSHTETRCETFLWTTVPPDLSEDHTVVVTLCYLSCVLWVSLNLLKKMSINHFKISFYLNSSLTRSS